MASGLFTSHCHDFFHDSLNFCGVFFLLDFGIKSLVFIGLWVTVTLSLSVSLQLRFLSHSSLRHLILTFRSCSLASVDSALAWKVLLFFSVDYFNIGFSWTWLTLHFRFHFLENGHASKAMSERCRLDIYEVIDQWKMPTDNSSESSVLDLSPLCFSRGKKGMFITTGCGAPGLEKRDIGTVGAILVSYWFIIYAILTRKTQKYRNFAA